MTLWGPAHGLGSAGAIPAHWLGRRLLGEQPQPEEELEYIWPEIVESLELRPRIVSAADWGDVPEVKTLELAPDIASTASGSITDAKTPAWGVGLWGLATWGSAKVFCGDLAKIRQSLELRPVIVESGPADSVFVEQVVPEDVVIYKDDDGETFGVYVDYEFTVKLIYSPGTGGSWSMLNEDPELPIKNSYIQSIPPWHFQSYAIYVFEPAAINAGKTYTLIFELRSFAGQLWDTVTFYVAIPPSEPIPETAGPRPPNTEQLVPQIAGSTDDSPRPDTRESSGLVPQISNSEDTEEKPNAATVTLTPKLVEED